MTDPMKRIVNGTLTVGLLLLACAGHAEMEPLGDETMSNVKGQNGGMSLSGDISFNASGSGGPLSGEGVGFDCNSGGRCGSRIATQFNDGGGYFVLDDLQGTFAFEGLTLQTRKIDSGDSGFGGDAGDFNRTVIEIGMPDTARFENFSFTAATSTTARPTGTDFQQTDRIGVEIEGGDGQARVMSFSRSRIMLFVRSIGISLLLIAVFGTGGIVLIIFGIAQRA